MREWTWEHRAMAIFFYHHPGLADGNVTVAVRALGVKPGTLRDWLYNKSLRSKWVPIFPSLTSSAVLKSVVLKHHAIKFRSVAKHIPRSRSVLIEELSEKPNTQLKFCFNNESVQKTSQLRN